MIRLEEYDKSRFWKQIEKYDKDKGDKTIIDSLKANIRQVADKSEEITKLIIRYLPQYTLHDKTHILNVLSIMDALVPKKVMDNLTPLECAICIMSAYTHDLGMALTDDEYKKITDEKDTPERQKFLRFRDGFGEETRQIERWEKKGGDEARKRVDLIEGHILASYIRDTHYNEEVNRVENWLDKIMEVTENRRLFFYGDHDYKHDLALIDISHGKSVSWFRNIYYDKDNDKNNFCLLVGDENVNLAFPSLLLRLADIMDFDATRTPKILFKHIGIENEKSILEWEKHLQITGRKIYIKEKNPIIKYTARCVHPVHQKSIIDFLDIIDQEIKAVRDEISIQCRNLDESDRRYELWLPVKIDNDDVQPEGYPTNPKYIYEDIEFRLDQDEIHQLLLGESLWGDPKLCIRELLQNALDALQMRDLRLEIQNKGESPSEPVDRLTDELKVTLTWGHDKESGQDYILVKDNGVGMTKEVITKYFTQIGKSFYRSPDFEREKKLMEEKGLLAAPISIFGIGILSCFMIGDRLQVRTRPGGANNNDRRAYDITISGPGSLFWLKEGTLKNQGTEVKIFLKKEYIIKHEPESLMKRLQEHFLDTYENQREEDGESGRYMIDPVLIAGSYAVCPLYSIEIIHPSNDCIIRIDDYFHMNKLFPIDIPKLLKKANEYGCPKSYIGDVEWGIWDWTDNITGSRIWLWFPRNYKPDKGCNLPIDPPEDMELCRQDELSAFAETQFWADRYESNRTLIMVKGFYIQNISVCKEAIPVSNRIGSVLWIDLRGDAAPKLTADRQKAIQPLDEETWHKEIQDVFVRMVEDIQNDIDKLPEASGVLKNIFSAIRWHNSIRPNVAIKNQNRQLNIINAYAPKWNPSGKYLEWLCVRFIQASGDLGILKHELDDCVRVNIRDYALYHDPHDVYALDFVYNLGNEFPHVPDLSETFASLYPLFKQCLYSSILQEAFMPDLSISFPMLNCFHLKGNIGDAIITSPGLIEFDLESNGQTLHPVDRQGEDPTEIAQYGYDLVFPMTTIPLGNLRRQCPEWRSNRRLRPIGVLPFLLFFGNEFITIWAKYSEYFSDLFKVDHIFALMPDMEYWSKPFSDWTEKDWNKCGLSAFWDIKSGRVLWADGAQTADNMDKIGRPIEQFLEAVRK